MEFHDYFLLFWIFLTIIMALFAKGYYKRWREALDNHKSFMDYYHKDIRGPIQLYVSYGHPQVWWSRDFREAINDFLSENPDKYGDYEKITIDVGPSGIKVHTYLVRCPASLLESKDTPDADIKSISSE